jgi:hypothetical protein
MGLAVYSSSVNRSLSNFALLMASSQIELVELTDGHRPFLSEKRHD